MEETVQKLIEKGRELLRSPRKVEFTRDSRADAFLNNLAKYPHAFVLGCVMDRQIKSEKAWIIPYKVNCALNDFEFHTLSELTQDWLRQFFESHKLHRFPRIMADNFYSAIRGIDKKYLGKAEKIWADNPKSATIVRRFLEFSGVGVKIASMAANILVRDFKIPVADKLCIDISPDVQVKRVFIRLGLIRKGASNEELIYLARELNPEYPGIVDGPAWEIGKNWCGPKNPTCGDCYLNDCCPKVGVS